VRLPLSTFFEAPTVAQMAARLGAGPQSSKSRVLPIRSGDGRAPFFLLHAGPMFRVLASALPEGTPVSTISAPSSPEIQATDSLERIAAHEVDVLLGAQPAGPYALGGWCVDGLLALEIARQIQASGRGEPLVVLLDTFNLARWRGVGSWRKLVMKSAGLASRIRYHAANLINRRPPQGADHLAGRWRMWRDRKRRIHDVGAFFYDAARCYAPQPYHGPIVLFRPTRRPAAADRDSAAGWSSLLPNLEVVDVPGDHIEMLTGPGVHVIAQRIAALMEEQRAQPQ
jgi:thioesterase domain-containing protein